jgi:UDP:flavonoid glycosyltransferase YjiC (YdhE family)
VIPIGGDQPYTAERVEALGLGRAVSPDERDPQTIRSRIREVLAEPRFRDNAQAFAAEMQALPPIGHAVELLEQLARDHRPILR